MKLLNLIQKLKMLIYNKIKNAKKFRNGQEYGSARWGNEKNIEPYNIRGKTRFFVKPNLMQMHSSYVVTDPKGTLILEYGKMLKKGGYNIKILNTIKKEENKKGELK